MPAKSEKQRKFFGAELERRRSGKSPQIKGISTKKVRDFAKKKS